MKIFKNLINHKSRNFYALSKTVQEIFQLFLEHEKSVAAKKGLSKVLSFFDADRIYIGYFNNDESTISFIHECTASGVDTATSLLNQQFSYKKTYSETDYPLWVGNIKNGIDTVISDIDKMPMISNTEIPLMIENNVKSSLTTSIHEEGKVCGFLGIEFVNRKHKWSMQEIDDIHFFANIFSVVIENEYMQKEIIQTSFEAFKNETIFQLVFDTLPVGIELYDENGYLRKINPFGLTLLGTTEEEVLGVNLFENPNIPKISFANLKKGEPALFENDYCFDKVQQNGYFNTSNRHKVIRLIGNCTPLQDVAGNIFGYLNLVHNDTSYYKTKAEIKSNLAKLQMAIDAQKSFFWEYDVKTDKTIIDFDSLDNERKEKMRKFYDAYTVDKLTHLEQVHPDDKERIKGLIMDLLSGKINSFEDTYREYINGELLCVFTSFKTFKYDENNLPETIVCLTTDITEQREKDLELIQSREFNRIRSSFVSNISHEIRTPLNAILGFTKIITDANKSEESQYFNEIVQHNNEILLHMIDSILSFTKIEAGPILYQKEPVDVKELCRMAINLKSFNKKEDIAFVFDENQSPLLVHTDKEYIKQAIYHLLDNANKFTEKGSVSLSYHKNEEGEAVIKVTDTGIGLTPAEIEKIFDRFYKNDIFQRGVGLGLSMTRKFILDLGGKVGVDSEKGKGSTFWFTLPCVEAMETV